MKLLNRLLERIRFVEPYREPLYFVVFGAILNIQLFLPPSVGNADNADSARLIGGSGLVPNYPENERYFAYFTPDYVRTKPDSTVGPPRWCTSLLSFRISQALGRLKTNDRFDLRWLGFVHMLIYLFDFGLLLRVLRLTPASVRWSVPALAIWIFGDVVYTAYLNSFYLDAMGLLCFAALVLTLISMLAPGSGRREAARFALAGVAFAASKPLNAPVAALFGFGVIAHALLIDSHRRNLKLVAASITLFAGLLFTAATPYYYGYPGLVDTVMLRIAKLPDAKEQIAYFGLTPSDLRFAGQNTFTPNGPATDPGFRARFAHTTSLTLAGWYLLHPTQTLRFLREDLTQSAPGLRPLGDLEKQYSASGNRSRRFCSWSDLKSLILRNWPAVIPSSYVVALLLAGFLLVQRHDRAYSAFGLTLVLIAFAGLFNFAAGCLLDAIETKRHLFMFHTATDAMLLVLFRGALTAIPRGRPRDTLAS